MSKQIKIISAAMRAIGLTTGCSKNTRGPVAQNLAQIQQDRQTKSRGGVEQLLEDAQAAIESNTYSRVVQLCEQAQDYLITPTQRTQILCAKGIAFIGLGKLEQAREYFKSAVKVKPHSENTVIALCLEGAIFYALNRFKEAQKCCADALNIKPNSQNALDLLDRIRTMLKSPPAPDDYAYVKELCFNAYRRVNRNISVPPLDKLEVQFLSPANFRKFYVEKTGQSTNIHLSANSSSVHFFVTAGLFCTKNGQAPMIALSHYNRWESARKLSHELGHYIVDNGTRRDQFVEETLAYYVGNAMCAEIGANILPLEESLLFFETKSATEQNGGMDTASGFALASCDTIELYSRNYEKEIEDLLHCRTKIDVEKLIDNLQKKK